MRGLSRCERSGEEGPIIYSGYSGRAPSKALPDGGPTPRLADGHPDFSGVWFQGLLGKEDATLVGSFGVLDPNQRTFDPKVTPEEKPSFQPWAAAKLKEQQANLVANRQQVGNGEDVEVTDHEA